LKSVKWLLNLAIRGGALRRKEANCQQHGKSVWDGVGVTSCCGENAQRRKLSAACNTSAGGASLLTLLPVRNVFVTSVNLRPASTSFAPRPESVTTAKSCRARRLTSLVARSGPDRPGLARPRPGRPGRCMTGNLPLRARSAAGTGRPDVEDR